MRRNFAVTTSGVDDPRVLALWLTSLGDDNVMFAIDYPYEDTTREVTGQVAGYFAMRQSPGYVFDARPWPPSATPAAAPQAASALTALWYRALRLLRRGWWPAPVAPVWLRS